MISRNPRTPPPPRAFPAAAAALALSLPLVVAVSAPAYVGQWHSFTDKSRVTALIAHEGFVYAGTRGGVRRIDPGTLAQREFDNLDGLLDVWIAGLARDGAGTLWAVTRDGFVCALAKGGNRWEIWGRSYAAQQWKMNDRAVLAADSSLYLGSQKGLAVFDVNKKVSQVNLTRFGNDLDLPVLSLLRRGDTLYAGTPAGVYKAYVNFANPLNPPAGLANFADPAQWSKVEFPPDPGRLYHHLAFAGDTLKTYGPGTLLQPPGQAGLRVEAFSGRPLVLGGQQYPADWNDFVTAVGFDGKIFAGGDSRLAFWSAPPGAPDTLLAPLKAHPRETIVNIGANSGAVWGHSYSGLHRGDLASRTFVFSGVPVIESDAPEARGLRNTKVDANGTVYLGTWGEGLNRVRNDQKEVWKAASGSCIYQVETDPARDTTWTVVHALSTPRKGGLFFAVFKIEGDPDHQLAYFDTASGTVSCPPLGASVEGGYPHAVHAFSDSLLGVATDRGVVFFKTRRAPGGTVDLESPALWTLPGTANEAWDLAEDFWERPWALIGPGLAYLDSLDQSTQKKLKPIDNFIGEDCRSLERDPAGALWAGCANGLFHVRTGPAGEAVAIRRYGRDDGLLSLVIHDVSVDPSDGRVWIATDRGVSMFESASQPAPPGGRLAAVVPYPNPFRPQHAFVVFEGLPSNSTLRIHDPSGGVVRVFHPRDLKGNQALWDGKNDRGRAVAPGVYLFSVSSGSAVQRGKVIVAR